MNHITINNKQIPLTQEQAEAILSAIREMEPVIQKQVVLSDIPVGEIVKIAGLDMLILEQTGDETAMITKNLLDTRTIFSESNNNYNKSLVDDICESFAELLEDSVGAENILEHEVNLTTDDGLKDYGKVRRRASLLTTDLYRRYVEILDKFKPDSWWWLATSFSTKRHDNDLWVKCVSPSGYINCYHCGRIGTGVRPFCILNSSIFISR